MHLFPDLIPNLLSAHTHGDADQKATGDDQDSSDTRKVRTEQFQVLLNTPSDDVHVGMNQRTDKNRPSAVDMQLM